MNEWFVLKNEDKIGPFSYVEMIQLLQDGKLFPFDYVWSEGMDTWTPVADVDDFSPAKLAQMLGSEELRAAFAQRRFPRVLASIPVMVHNDDRFGTGLLQSISVGGALVNVDVPTLLPQETILVHCRGIEGVIEPFNFEFSISNKSWNRNRIQHKSKVSYAGSFAEISPLALAQIRLFIENKLTGGVA